MTTTSKRQVASLLQERYRAMDGCRFRPENFHEIQRVLGSRYAPDLNRVVSKHRAHAASAYLRRLHRDVEKSQGGYYGQVQAMPLQIKRLTIKREDPRSFKSVLVPKLKLSPLGDAAPSPRSPVVGRGADYVPHKSFNPHSHTHIHVLFKQMPASTSGKGGHSVVSSSGRSSSVDPGLKTQPPGLKAGKLSPRDGAVSRVDEEGGGAGDGGEEAWPSQPLPYALPKFVPSPNPLPHIKRRLSLSHDRSPRGEKQQSSTPAPLLLSNVNTTAPSPHKSGEASPVTQFSPRGVLNGSKDRLPANVAAALAEGNPTAALYKFDLPSRLAASYNKNLPTTERTKVGAKPRHPLPSIPTNAISGNELLAIISVQNSNAMQAAA